MHQLLPTCHTRVVRTSISSYILKAYHLNTDTPRTKPQDMSVGGPDCFRIFSVSFSIQVSALPDSGSFFVSTPLYLLPALPQVSSTPANGCSWPRLLARLHTSEILCINVVLAQVWRASSVTLCLCLSGHLTSVIARTSRVCCSQGCSYWCCHQLDWGFFL